MMFSFCWFGLVMLSLSGLSVGVKRFVELFSGTKDCVDDSKQRPGHCYDETSSDQGAAYRDCGEPELKPSQAATFFRGSMVTAMLP
jgi:hypothetical protein